MIGEVEMVWMMDLQRSGSRPDIYSPSSWELKRVRRSELVVTDLMTDLHESHYFCEWAMDCKAKCEM